MKAIRYGLLAVAAALVLTGCTVQVSVDSCRYSEELTASVPVGSEKVLNVYADTGSLTIEGRPDLKEVRVRGTACASTESQLSSIQLKAEPTGEQVRVEAVLPKVNFGNSPSLSLVIEVPEAMQVRVTDDSGDVRIERVAGVDIDDQSGSVVLQEIAGRVVIRDDSGDVEVRDVTGDVEVEDDQSGSMTFTKIRGNLIINRDDSGDITANDVAGSVTIDRDESGNITISGVKGSVTVNNDDSGSIDVRDITGDFTVKADGSGTIYHSGVGGTVKLPAKR